MVKVAAFSVAGLTLSFRSRDHPPPHFHVHKLGWWEIRVFIDATVAENKLSYAYKFPKSLPRNFRGLTSDEERLLLIRVLEYREILLAEWMQKVCPSEDVQ
ncbi:MAG: DUF4160 domain-containing protein [Cyanobacteria bacterium REEB67]|nr:DUF4160 domain-containing protein [Cyanobacteria bacterium REEB67]